MENYEQKYKEALERAKNIIEDLRKGKDMLTVSDLESIFPELAESEDEKIRKWLIAQLEIKGSSNNVALENNIIKAIAWLEKQKPVEVEDYNGIDPHFGKPIFNNKVESKFKVGDWVVHNYSNTIWKIVSMEGNDVSAQDIIELENQEGTRYQTEKYDLIDNYHLWNIQDAKDGDVLCLHYKDKKYICIFQSITEDNAGIRTYCAYVYKCQSSEEHFISECRLHNPSGGGYFTPATKEQRALLVSKMKEADYDWDAGKKKLKEIEQKSTEENKGNNGGISPNAKWSEEDNKMLNICIGQ